MIELIRRHFGAEEHSHLLPFHLITSYQRYTESLAGLNMAVIKLVLWRISFVVASKAQIETRMKCAKSSIITFLKKPGSCQHYNRHASNSTTVRRTAFYTAGIIMIVYLYPGGRMVMMTIIIIIFKKRMINKTEVSYNSRLPISLSLYFS